METTGALERGDAFVELDDAAVTRVSGSDARAWLGDLVTTDVVSLRPGEARPSLLLTPTGRIRAQFQVAATADDAFLLIQREPFETPVANALDPYVLSSDVSLSPAALVVVALPGVAPDDARLGAVAPDVTIVAPSILGSGSDALVATDTVQRVVDSLTARGLEPATAAAAESLRVRRGEPRFGVDLDAESLPAEGGLDAAPVTDRTKGCFLGQESIARVANLGHPNRLLLRVRSDARLRAGEPVHAGDESVGSVTSADGELAIVRVTWNARDQRLSTASGDVLETLGPVGNGPATAR